MKEVKHLLLDALTLCNSIDNGFSLFSGIEEHYKKTATCRAKVNLAAKVAELNNILNPQPLQSVVEIAEEVLK